jgi:murein DD-endopeptidase MepM/ murein hydrolase activator NlpD
LKRLWKLLGIILFSAFFASACSSAEETIEPTQDRLDLVSPTIIPSKTPNPTQTPIPTDPYLALLPNAEEIQANCTEYLLSGQASLWEVKFDRIAITDLLEIGVSSCYSEAPNSSTDDIYGIFSVLVAQNIAERDLETGFLLGPEFLLDKKANVYFVSGTDVAKSIDAEFKDGARPISISGRIFFDKNGSFEQDEGEPSVNVDSICVYVYVSGSTLRENWEEYCSENISGGNYSLDFFLVDRMFPEFEMRLEIPNDFVYRYINLSPEVTVYITETFTVSSDQAVVNLPLSVGFLSLPFSIDDPENIPSLASYTDHDYRVGYIRNWNGDSSPDIWDETHSTLIKTGTGDQHQGIDWAMPEGTPLLAVAPGWTMNVCEEECGAYYIRQVVDIPGDDKVYLIVYGHNSENLVEQSYTNFHERVYVSRGEIIALSGQTGGNTYPHIHFGVQAVPRGIFNELWNSGDLFTYLDERYQDFMNGNDTYSEHDPFLYEIWLQGSVIPDTTVGE